MMRAMICFIDVEMNAAHYATLKNIARDASLD